MTQETPVQLNIRPHLIHFLYMEFKGEVSAIYGQKKIKLAKVKKMSLLGNLISEAKLRAKHCNLDKISNYSIFFYLEEDKDPGALMHEKLYETKRGVYDVLSLLPKDVELINNFLESLYNIALVQFIKGYVQSDNSYDNVKKAIHQFMLKYNLYDTEIDYQSIRVNYYRAIKNDHLLCKIQHQHPNRSKYYHFL